MLPVSYVLRTRAVHLLGRIVRRQPSARHPRARPGHARALASRSRILFAALVLAGAASMNPREGLAQGCTTLDPPCPPNEPPNIWLVGESGTLTTPTLSLSVNLSDDRGLTGFNSSGATFSVQYNSTYTQGYGEASVTLSPNVATRITVWVRHRRDPVPRLDRRHVRAPAPAPAAGRADHQCGCA